MFNNIKNKIESCDSVGLEISFVVLKVLALTSLTAVAVLTTVISVIVIGR